MGKVGAALAAALTGTAVTLDQVDVITLTAGRKVGLALTTAALAFGSTSAAAVAEWRAQRAESHRDNALFRLRTLAFTVQDLTGIDVRDLGLACYVVRRARIRRWRHVLVRVARDRAARRPAVSGVRWRPGKGVVGLCVERGDIVGVDVDAVEAPWATATKEDWRDRVPADARMGLSYDEFRAVRGKYHAVVAAPMVDDSGAEAVIRGCVALDGPSGAFDDLWTDEVREALVAAADDMRLYVI